MICPYNYKTEITSIQWSDEPENPDEGKAGDQSSITTYNMMECEKENCAVWYDGACHYNGKQK